MFWVISCMISCRGCAATLCVYYTRNSPDALFCLKSWKKIYLVLNCLKGWFRFTGSLEHLSWISWCCISSTCKLGNQIAAVWSGLLIILKHHIYSPKWNERALEGRDFMCVVISIWERTCHYKLSNWDYWKESINVPWAGINKSHINTKIWIIFLISFTLCTECRASVTSQWAYVLAVFWTCCVQSRSFAESKCLP